MLHDVVCTLCRKTGEEEVRVKVLYCGICHSDLHCLKNEWHSSIYPLVPGYVIFFLFSYIVFLNSSVMLKKNLLSRCRLYYSPSEFFLCLILRLIFTRSSHLTTYHFKFHITIINNLVFDKKIFELRKSNFGLW